MSEKSKFAGILPSSVQENGVPPETSSRRHFTAAVRVVSGVVLGLWIILCHTRYQQYNTHIPTKTGQTCPQVDSLSPERNADALDAFSNVISADAFRQRAVDWLAGAVRVPTESYDQMLPVGEDPRWEKFSAFHEYLATAFPTVHASLFLTKVNTYGLVYVWQGSDPSLKPVLFAGHQDVVPVDPRTTDVWIHPPFSGFFDGENIWGRGSSDDKSGLIGILSSFELLLEQKFKPTRTVVLASGFDEEISGLHGARYLAQHLLRNFGENAFAFVIDEGGGFSQQYGVALAVPGIAEKGYIDVRVEVTSAGGHSSVPPKHTSIGMLASLLVKYEANPHKLEIKRESPVYATLQCLAAHAPSLPSDLGKAIKRSAHSDKGLRELEKIIVSDKFYSSLFGTTQAIDVIQGGVKSNALPEQAFAIVNHRISTESSLDAIKKHNTELLLPIASKFNLTYVAFDQVVSDSSAPSSGTLTLTDAFGHALAPAPVTPTGQDAAAYQLLSGTIKATYDAHRALRSADTIKIAPGIMSGNTDTRYYWDLSPHIFRYNHHNNGNSTSVLSGGIHTVNEHVKLDAFLEMIRFFGTLVLNADESTSL